MCNGGYMDINCIILHNNDTQIYLLNTCMYIRICVYMCVFVCVCEIYKPGRRNVMTDKYN